MAVLITFLLFFISGTLLLLLTGFISKYVYRIKSQCSSPLTGESEPLQPIVEDKYDEAETLKAMIERLGEQEDNSRSEFKFSFHFPEDIVRRSDEQYHTCVKKKGSEFDGIVVRNTPDEYRTSTTKEALDATTTVSNYRFLAEKDISGFMVDPEAMSCRIQGSFVADSGHDLMYDSQNLDGEPGVEGLSAKKGFQQSNLDDRVIADELEDEEEVKGFQQSNPDEVVLANELNDEEVEGFQQPNADEGVLDNELKDEEMKGFQKFNSVEGAASNELIDEMMSFQQSNSDRGVYTNELLDKELKSFQQSDRDEKTVTSEVKDDQVHSFPPSNSDEGNFANNLMDEEDKKENNCSIEKKSESMKSSQGEDVSIKELQSVANDLDVSLVDGRETSFRGCFLSVEDFDGMGLDSVSLSTISDGYSVKSLIIDADSDDGFLSDRDFCESERVDLDKENHMFHSGQKQNEDVQSLENYDTKSLDSMCSEGSMNCSVNQEEAKQFLEDAKYFNQVIQEANLVISRLSSPKRHDVAGECFPLNTRINSLDPLEDVYSEKSSDELENELNALEREETELGENFKSQEKEILNVLNLDVEFIDLESDEVSSLFVTRNHGDSHSDQFVEVPVLKHENSDEAEEEEVSFRNIKDTFHLSNSETVDSSEQQRPKILDTEEEFTNLENMREDSVKEKKQEKENLENFEVGNFEKLPGVRKGDFDELEALWEHQDLIEQLSEELMFVRSTGLETILEEPQSPNLAVKLEDWKFDAVFLHEKPKDELQIFYKIYRERMRKFDILNYQKMYAVDFLQLKDPQQSMSCQKPTVRSLLTQSFLPCRRRRSNNHTEKFIKELRKDLENVYVSQTCLSWEFLWWQYEKAQELPNSDRYGYRQYNRVAGEFQHFQVLIRRFIENEPFQLPRVPNYVKSRRDVCDLLQVPVIKEDNFKDKNDGIKKGNEAIMFEELNDIMEKSIRTFWQFVKADKAETSMIVKGLIGTQVDLQDATDNELMVDILAQLHKKEKKLKDILRVGNCLVKKFKKPEDYRSTQDMFFSLVDLKLISRVLQMPRITTDQLVWCHNKLSNITFVEKKIQREPAFLPFPCSA